MPAKKPLHPALVHLKKADPLLYRHAVIHAADILKPKTGLEKRYGNQELFTSLAASITGQQLSTKAADSIWERLRIASKGEVTPEAVKRLRVPTLRKAGLSAAKAKTLKELSQAVLSGSLDLTSLRDMPEDEAIAKLSSIWGIGRWTAEMFLMFALEREDVFSPGDLGLRRSMEALYGLPKDVHIRELEAIAIRWAPHRTFASRVLWRARDTKSKD